MAHTVRRHRSAAATWRLGTLLLSSLLGAAPAFAVESPRRWEFTALLDGRPIGAHRFELGATRDGVRSLLSQAQFDVKVLGITAYRYRHRSEEQWDANCLRSLASSTQDGGDVTAVNARTDGAALRIEVKAGRKPAQSEAAGCVMSFAYWHPRQLAQQSRLLDPDTGRIETVDIRALPERTLPVRGVATTVTGLRIAGLKHPIDVWYANEDWVGLDTTVERGRKLTYRLQ